MAKFWLGRKEFDVDREEIIAQSCGVSYADCAALAARMKAGEISKVKTLNLVRFFFEFCFFSIFFHFVGAQSYFFASTPLTLIAWQRGNHLGAEGAIAVADR
jgi:hypothetical protein